MTIPVTTSSYFRFNSLCLLDRVNLLLRDLQNYSFENTLCDHLHEKALTLSLKSCLNDCINAKLNTEETAALRNLVLEVKRKDFRHDVIWKTLPTNIQEFINALDPLTEDPTTQKTDFSSTFSVPNFTDYVNADFGDGRLFKVSNLTSTNSGISLDLVKCPNLKLFRFSSETARKKAMEKVARHAQLSVFQLPSIPFRATSLLIIEDKSVATPLSQVNFSTLIPSAISQIAQDIHAYIVTELVWNINLLGSKPEEECFALHNHRVVSINTGWQAKVLTEDVIARHQTIQDKLPNNPTLLKELESLKQKTNKNEINVTKELELLALFDCNPKEIAQNIDQYLILHGLVKYLNTHDKIMELFMCYRAQGVSPQYLLREYTRLLIQDHTSIFKSLEDTCEQQIHNKNRFFALLIYILCQQFELKSSLESQTEHVLNWTNDKLTEIGLSLNSIASNQMPHSFSSNEEFFWARVGNDFNELIASIVNEALDEKNVFQSKLTLIRYGSKHLSSSQQLNDVLTHTIEKQMSFLQEWQLETLTTLAQAKARQ